MGYFISMTWPWWLLAIALAIGVTWFLFRDKHGKRDMHDERARQEDRELGRMDARDVNVPSQHASLRERAEELKEKAAHGKGGRKFL